MDLALFEPDIPQNAGNMMRLGACLGVAVHVIEPAGFSLGEKAFRRAGLDYLDHTSISRHASWDRFEKWRKSQGRRLIALTTKGDTRYFDYSFKGGDVLLVGRETAGLPPRVHAAADARLVIPMRQGLRSLNVASAAAMVLGEALRQTRGFP